MNKERKHEYQQKIQQLKLISVFATASSKKSSLQMMCGQASGPKVHGPPKAN